MHPLQLVPPEPFDTPEERSLVLTHHTRASCGAVWLRGEFDHWNRRTPMRRDPHVPGRFETTVCVGPGVYAYKFETADGQWELDATHGRTRCVDGLRNSVAVIAGTDEPLLHAPVHPDVWRDDDGRIVIRAALRKRRDGAPRVWVRWDEGHGLVRQALRVVGEEDEHWLLEVQIGSSARRVEYLFELDDGRLLGESGVLGRPFVVSPAAMERSCPEAWPEAIVYTIFVDRFRCGGRDGAWPAWRPVPFDPRAMAAGAVARNIPHGRLDLAEQERMAHEQGWAGGDLEGVLEALPHLSDLGVDTLHLTPIFVARSSHRYDVVDPFEVDPELGGTPALRRLLDAAHTRSIRIVLDMPLGHVHRDFFAFADVRTKGPDSAYWGWFHIDSFPFVDAIEPGYRAYAKGAWQEPVLKTDEPAVVSYLERLFSHWTKFGVDGFRIDAAADLPLGLLRRLRTTVERINPHATLFGEVVPSNLHRWTGRAVHCATDFEAQVVCDSWLRTGEGAAKVVRTLARRRWARGGPGWSSMSFTATHDQQRLRTTAGAEAAALGHVLVLTRETVPALLYGDEVGLQGEGTPRSFEDVWPDRAPMPWDRVDWDEDTLGLVRALVCLRRREPALSRGNEQAFVPRVEDGPPDAVVALRRRWRGRCVDVLLNPSEARCRVVLPPVDLPGVEVLFRYGLAQTQSTDGAETTAVTLGPRSAIVLARRPSEDAEALLSHLAKHGGAQALEAFRHGALTTLSLPTRLYLTVTERCNLRCEHCITHAPHQTRSGRARTLQPWVLDALEPVLARAEYFAFSHGGESLVAPEFSRVLERIAAARSSDSSAYHVHLLTNGMRFTLERARELCRLGLSSVAVSLDGATPGTNDRLRVGARWEQIVRQLREIAAWRRTEGIDLRLGISTVVTRDNLEELVVLGQQVRDWDLDWLKVEECHPATVEAARVSVRPEDADLRAAVQDVRNVLLASGVVLVEHLAVPSGCPCDASEHADGATLRRFLRADAFANRAHFPACRMPWEQACVDPDGTVRAVSYESPPLGNLAEASFLALWNAAAVQRQRLEASQARSPEQRRRCPGGDYWGTTTSSKPAPVMSE